MKTAVRRVYEWEPGDGDLSIAWMHKLVRHEYNSPPRPDEEKPLLLIPYEQERNLKMDPDIFKYVSPMNFHITECCGFKIQVIDQ